MTTDANDIARRHGADGLRRAWDSAPTGDAMETTETGEPKTGTDEEAICRLGALSPVEYDRVRETEAANLGARVSTLDSLVKQARQANAAAYEAEADAAVGGLFTGEEPWPEPVDGKQLVTQIQSIIRSHVILSEQQALAVALWVLLTYVFRAFRICPRLLVSSPENGVARRSFLRPYKRCVPGDLRLPTFPPPPCFGAWRPGPPHY